MTKETIDFDDKVRNSEMTIIVPFENLTDFYGLEIPVGVGVEYIDAQSGANLTPDGVNAARISGTVEDVAKFLKEVVL